MNSYFIYFLLGHFIADFICQTHWQASNKSKSLNALLRHVGSYTLVFLTFSFAAFDFKTAIQFATINGTLHLLTDFFTSKWTAYLWTKQKIHDFFVVIGLDQFIHQLCIFSTLYWVLK